MTTLATPPSHQLRAAHAPRCRISPLLRRCSNLMNLPPHFTPSRSWTAGCRGRTPFKCTASSYLDSLIGHQEADTYTAANDFSSCSRTTNNQTTSAAAVHSSTQMWIDTDLTAALQLERTRRTSPSRPSGPDISFAATHLDYRGVRKTKLVCTIGPSTWSRENLFKLAEAGMAVARLNMSHGDHASHKKVVDLVREYNALGRNSVAIMLDTKGPEVRSGDLQEPLDMQAGQQFVFTIQAGANGKDNRISVNYDGFIDDVSVGDTLLVDGGIISFDVVGKNETDVQVKVVDGGVMGSRRHLNVRGKSATLPAITDKDWLDLQFGVDVGVDYYALSFVQSAEVVHEVKQWLQRQGSNIGVLAKIESATSVQKLDEILDAVDGAMVARGDLGAELPVEEVPYWQSKIIQGCRRRGKPVIVATNMLESMTKNATPTRAEVSDIAIAVREGTDAVMLSGETAYGNFPMKAVNMMSTVAFRTEQSMTKYQGIRRFGSEEAPPIDWIQPPSQNRHGKGEPPLAEMFAFHATSMANTIRTPLLVFSRKGNMPALLSHYRPDWPIFAFTEDEAVQRRLALYLGVIPLTMKFRDTAEETFDEALSELTARGYLQKGQQVAIVQSGKKPIWRSSSTHTIQVRKSEKRHVLMRSMDEDEDEGPVWHRYAGRTAQSLQ